MGPENVQNIIHSKRYGLDHILTAQVEQIQVSYGLFFTAEQNQEVMLHGLKKYTEGHAECEMSLDCKIGARSLMYLNSRSN